MIVKFRSRSKHDNTKNAEGAVSFDEGIWDPGNRFPFQGSPSDPQLVGRHEVALERSASQDPGIGAPDPGGRSALPMPLV